MVEPFDDRVAQLLIKIASGATNGQPAMHVDFEVVEGAIKARLYEFCPFKHNRTLSDKGRLWLENYFNSKEGK